MYFEHDGYDERSRNAESVNTSPVNFFSPLLKKFPHFKNIGIVDKKAPVLKAGDCVFVPAYYFYQWKAHNLSPAQLHQKMTQNPMFNNPVV